MYKDSYYKNEINDKTIIIPSYLYHWNFGTCKGDICSEWGLWWYIKKMRVESLSINEIMICLFVCYQAIIFANINLNLNWNTTNILPRQSLIWPSLNPCTMINPVLLTYSKTNKLKLMSMKYSPFCPWTNELNLQVCQMKFTLILNRIFSDEWKHSPVSLTIIHVKNHKSHNAPYK